jgi:hypothetical protein
MYSFNTQVSDHLVLVVNARDKEAKLKNRDGVMTYS